MSDKTIQNTTVGTVQPGALTAIARKEDFLQHLQDFLDTHKTEKWCVAAIDVEHFRLYNELYGTEQGNTLLKPWPAICWTIKRPPAALWATGATMTFSSACRTTACSSRTS